MTFKEKNWMGAGIMGMGTLFAFLFPGSGRWILMVMTILVLFSMLMESSD